MVEIVISVAAKVAEYLVDPIIRPLGYLFNYRRNFTDFNQQIQMLHHVSVRLQQSVEEANRQGDEIFPDVQEWLKVAQGIIQKREDFIEDEKKASKSCFYLKSRYQLSKQAQNQAAKIVDKIQEAHTFDGRVSYRPPPPVISSASFKDYEAFQSRTTTFSQIIEALRNEDISMIGVWGMGGVGKTTLVKQVAKQAEEHELFHKVVMVLNISQSPNIAEIQGKIARMLGLKFEVEEDRAGRLRQRLKKEDKILVILDDIWKKLELGEIGIPYGDDHKGCKVVLTSRERRVLSKDMRTQKEFHLQHLSEDEAWNLFKKTAGDCVEKQREELLPIAVDVAKECGGLPVAIVTIANALRDEKVPVWRNALDELKTGAPTSIPGVDEKVYACLELSYNHLKGNEVKSLFLLCALMGDGDISMDRLLQYAMGLNLFEGISWDKATNKLITLVENLKASSLLLDGENEDDEKSLFFDESTVLRMHDVVGDVARSIASKDPHQFVVKEVVGLQEEWQWMDECRSCSRISLKCRNIDEFPQGLVCPKLEFFLLDSSNDDDEDDDDSYLEISDAFLQDTKQLRVLDLFGVSLAPSPSSLGFLSNIRTLCLNRCVLQDIAVIGDLKRLQVLSLAKSHIEQLPKEMMQLSDLRVLDLRNCYRLIVIPRNVISSLSRLEYLSMEECSKFEWEKEGFNSGEIINNACVSELKHLSGLRSLEVEVRDPSLLPEDDVLFDNLNLTRYSIVIGDPISTVVDMPNDEYKVSRRLSLDGVKSLHMVKRFSQLLKRSQLLGLSSLNDTKHVVYELDKEGFVELKYLHILKCPSIQYILHSSTSVEWAPPPNTFCMLENLDLYDLDNLEVVCDGPIPMGFFGNLRILTLKRCKRLKYVFSVPTQHGREPAFPQLQELTLGALQELISFYSTRSSGSEDQELVTFFNPQVTFPSLEFLTIVGLNNVRALWHNQLPADSFSKLRELNIRSCNKLLNIFPSDNQGLQSLQIPILDLYGPTPMGFFGNLRILRLERCKRLKYVLSLSSTQHGRELAFPQLQSLEIEYLPEVISFYSTRGSGSEESVTFFNQQATFPALESFFVGSLDNVRALWHNQLLEDSFPKLKNLYVNSCNKLRNVFPFSMEKAFLQLENLQIKSCGVLEAIVANENEDEDELAFPHLQSLELMYLREVISFYLTRSSGSKESVTFFNQQATFPALESLVVWSLDNVRTLWHNQGPVDSFSKLKKLCVNSCNKLRNVFPFSMAKALVQLENLHINFCGELEAIVANENEDEDEATRLVLFPKLTSLTVDTLPQLKRFCSGRFTSRWPLLKNLKVCNCDKVEIFFEEMSLEGELHNKIQQPLFLVEKEAFPNLEELRLTLKGIVEIWRGQFSRLSFSKLRVLNVTGCHGISVVISSNMVQILHNLERLEVDTCDSVNEVIQVERLSGEEFHVETLPRLTEICLKDLPMLMHLSGLNPYFQSFQTLKIVSCGSLINLVTPSMAKRLVQLKTLIIKKCDMLEIVGNEGDESTNDEIDFTNLKRLELHSLPNLKSFCSARYTFRFPSLEEMSVVECPKMDFFCEGVLDTPRLKGVQMAYDIFTEECWKGDLNTTIHNMFMEQDQTPFSVGATTQLNPRLEGVRTRGERAQRMWKRRHRSVLRDAPSTDINSPPMEETISPPPHQQPISSIAPLLLDQTPFSVGATTQLHPLSKGVRTRGGGAHKRWKRRHRSVLRDAPSIDISLPPMKDTPITPMEVPSTLPIVPLVASSPQPLEFTLVDKKLVPLAYDD